MNSTDLQMQARLVRRAARRLFQMARFGRLSLAGVPVLLANSFPKSGTHLLTQVLQGFSLIGPAVDSGLPAIVTYQGDSGRQRQEAEILADLGRLQAGDIAYGHIHALPQVVRLLCQPGYVAYFILRDPRDVVVSHVHYVTEMEPNHAHHRYYNQELHSFDERLAVSILGRPDSPVPFPDVQARFAPYLGWLNHPEIRVLHFEDFIQQQPVVLGQVLDHALQRGFPLGVSRPAAIQALAKAIDPQRSPTFRSGKVGGWRDQFSAENKQLFKRVAGELLLQLGYETDDDW